MINQTIGKGSFCIHDAISFRIRTNTFNVLYLTISEPLNLKNKNGERIVVDSEKAGEIMKGAILALI